MQVVTSAFRRHWTAVWNAILVVIVVLLIPVIAPILLLARYASALLRAIPRVAWWLFGGSLALCLYLLAIWAAPRFTGVPELAIPPSPDAVLTARHNSRLLVISLFGAFVVAAGLVYTARNYGLARRGQVTDRFTKALERLGSTEMYVRVGGIHALHRVMADSADHQDDIAGVLVAFLRHRVGRVPEPEESALSARISLPTEPGPDVQAALSVLGNRPRSGRTRQVIVDLSGLNLQGVNLSGTSFVGANFTNCDLRRTNLQGVNLNGADLRCVDLSNVRISGATIERADLENAKMNGSTIFESSLQDSRMSKAQLAGARIIKTNLQRVELMRANLRGVLLLDVLTSGALVNGADANEAEVQFVSIRRRKKARAGFATSDALRAATRRLSAASQGPDRARMRD
ncbi:Non-specific serine/threonine protein kinase [Micromonospora saelicesensis]|nr:Non-specific serine/threonine protein kinase [Micromonospora saelicesensis]